MQIGVIPKVNSFSIGITKSEVKQSSMSDNKVVLIAYDGSEHSKYALKCMYFHYCSSTHRNFSQHHSGGRNTFTFEKIMVISD